MNTNKAKTRVLVIEDNPDFAQIIHDILEIKGCDATIAANAVIGYEVARKLLPDIIFCDIRMPGGMNGLQFAVKLRADAELGHIPLVAISGYTSDDDKQAALAAGFNMIFPKPVKFFDLTKALEEFG